MNSWIEPDWPAPNGVRAASTLRAGGVSNGPYASFNLGGHVGDDAASVDQNRRRLRQLLELPDEPRWLQQVHGTRAIDADDADRTADASVSTRPGVVCAVMTADCLPILLCSGDGQRIGAVHAGWRGLAGGVVASAVDRLGTRELMAWLGPAIGPSAFEVGDEVRHAFTEQRPALAPAFRTSGNKRWHADIYALARALLAEAGVTACFGGDHCTVSDTGRFFSYRRDGVTGRMATLIWRKP
ncbi:MAG: peptidoglycan editing factor PgeF [Methylotetracoccus sp.]